jgi:hypothetical protein
LSLKRTVPGGRSVGNYNVLSIIHAQIFWFADYPCMTIDVSEKVFFFLILIRESQRPTQITDCFCK